MVWRHLHLRRGSRLDMFSNATKDDIMMSSWHLLYLRDHVGGSANVQPNTFLHQHHDVTGAAQLGVIFIYMMGSV